jgi:hypothetical protein
MNAKAAGANRSSEDSAIQRMRMLGAWSARAIFLIDVAYVAAVLQGKRASKRSSLAW